MNTDDLYRILRTGHAQAQGIVDTISIPLLVLDAGLCVQVANLETFCVDSYDTIGRPIYELGNGQWDIPDLRRLLSNVIPRAATIINYEVEHEFPELGKKTMLVTARKLHQADGSSHSMLLMIEDVTERHRQDVTNALLVGELRHRMSNLLAVIQSLARQTPTVDRSAEEYRDAFLGRLSALIKAENVTFDGEGVTGLQDLLKRILGPFSAQQDAVAITPGPQVKLSHRQIRSLSLVLHELATNAAKYGPFRRLMARCRSAG